MSFILFAYAVYLPLLLFIHVLCKHYINVLRMDEFYVLKGSEKKLIEILKKSLLIAGNLFAFPLEQTFNVSGQKNLPFVHKNPHSIPNEIT